MRTDGCPSTRQALLVDGVPSKAKCSASENNNALTLANERSDRKTNQSSRARSDSFTRHTQLFSDRRCGGTPAMMRPEAGVPTYPPYARPPTRRVHNIELMSRVGLTPHRVAPVVVSSVVVGDRTEPRYDIPN